MVAVPSIERAKRIVKPGGLPCDLRSAYWPPMSGCEDRWSKLMLDWSPEQVSGWLKTSIPRTRACACPTRPFTVACSFKRVEY
jgi:hypothetical protein